MSIAPKEQIEIPFIVWTSKDAVEVKELAEVGQYHVFHSVMDFLGVESPIFDEDKNIFK
jgi:lipid A ethanolaminephosphotransferase